MSFSRVFPAGGLLRALHLYSCRLECPRDTYRPRSVQSGTASVGHGDVGSPADGCCAARVTSVDGVAVRGVLAPEGASRGWGQSNLPQSHRPRAIAPGRGAHMQQSTFADLGVSEPVPPPCVRADRAPFPVQELVIGDVLDGHDVLVKSPTGSGKTLAFGIPLAIASSRAKAGRSPGAAGALVLAPTRELATQIADELVAIARARRLSVAAVYGGAASARRSEPCAAPTSSSRRPAGSCDLIDRRAVSLGRGRDARSRRGGQDARHGLPAGRRQARRAHARRPPDAALLGDARRRGRDAWAGLHDAAPADTSTGPQRRRRGRSSTASCA